MANTCCTDVQFTGDENAIKDLFKHLTTGWLGDIAEKFGISEADILAVSSDTQPLRGSIEDIDEKAYRIYQSDAWVPHTDIWRVISEKVYENKISYVFKAEECGDDIYVNTDTSGIYFPEKFVCDYEYNGESDVVYFEDEEDLLKWLSEKFGVTAENVSDAKDLLEEKCEDENDTYFTIGEFQNEWC